MGRTFNLLSWLALFTYGVSAINIYAHTNTSQLCLARGEDDAVHAVRCTGSPKENWNVVGENIKFGDDNNLCLQVNGEEPAEGSRVGLGDCNNSPQQGWARTKEGLQTRLDEALCIGLAGDASRPGPAPEASHPDGQLALQRCDNVHLPLRYGVSHALLQMFQRSAGNDLQTELETLSNMMINLTAEQDRQITGVSSPFATKLANLQSSIALENSRSRDESNTARSSFGSIKSEVERMLAEAKPMHVATEEKFAQQDRKYAAVMNVANTQMMTETVKETKDFFSKYDKDVAKQFGSKFVKFEKSQRKRLKKESKAESKFVKTVEKTTGKLFKKATKAQTKYVKKLSKNTDKMYDYADQALTESENLDQMAQEAEFGVETVASEGTQAAPALANVEEDMEYGLEKLNEHIETELQWAGLDFYNQRRLKQEKLRLLLEKFRNKATKEQEKAMKKFEKFVNKAYAKIMKVAEKTQAYSMKAAKTLFKNLQRESSYQTELLKFQTVIDVAKHTNDYMLENYRETTKSALQAVVEWARARIPGDREVLMEYLESAEGSLDAFARLQLKHILDANLAVLQEKWVDMQGALQRYTTRNAVADNFITDITIKLLGPALANLQKNLAIADTITLASESLDEKKIEAMQMEANTKVEGLNIASLMLSQLDTLKQDVKKKFSGESARSSAYTMGTLKKLSKENERGFAAVGGQARDMVDSINSEVNVMKYQMNVSAQKMEKMERDGEHIDGRLSFTLPSEMESFGDFFKTAMSRHEYGIENIRGQLNNYAETEYTGALSKVNDMIQKSSDLMEKQRKEKFDWVADKERETENEFTIAEAEAQGRISDMQKKNGDMDTQLDAIMPNTDYFYSTTEESFQKFKEKLTAAHTKAQDEVFKLNEARTKIKTKLEAMFKKELADPTTAAVQAAVADLGTRTTDDLIPRINTANAAASNKLKGELQSYQADFAAKMSEMDSTLKMIKTNTDRVQKVFKATDLDQYYGAFIAAQEADVKALGDYDETSRYINHANSEVMRQMFKDLGLAEAQVQDTEKLNEELMLKRRMKLKERRASETAFYAQKLEESTTRSAADQQRLLDTLADEDEKLYRMKSRIHSGEAEQEAAYNLYADKMARQGEKEMRNLARGDREERRAGTELADEIQRSKRDMQKRDAAGMLAFLAMEQTVQESMGTLQGDDKAAAAQRVYEQLMARQQADAEMIKRAENDATNGASKESMEVFSDTDEMMRKFREGEAGIDDLGRGRAKEIDEFKTRMAQENDGVDSILMAVKDLFGTAKDYIRERQDGILAKHQKNEDALKLLDGMSEFSDADSLTKVITAVQDAKQKDYELETDLNYVVVPQFRYFRDGLTQIFDNLGQSLDLDAIATNARNKLAAEIMASENIGNAGDQLEALLQAEAIMGKYAQRGVYLHIKGALDDIMARNDISTAEKLRLIEAEKQKFKKQEIERKQKIVALADRQDKIKIKIMKLRSEVKSLMTRAEEAAKPSWTVETRGELAKRGQSIAMRGDDMNRAITDLGSANSISLLQGKGGLSPHSSLLQENDATSIRGKTTATATAALLSEARNLRTTEVERDQEDADWDQVLNQTEVLWGSTPDEE